MLARLLSRTPQRSPNTRSKKRISISSIDVSGMPTNIETSRRRKGEKKPGQLIFLRHGQSTWNQQNVFIGMTDTPLTPDGVLEARVAGRCLLSMNLPLLVSNLLFHSFLRRSFVRGACGYRRGVYESLTTLN